MVWLAVVNVFFFNDTATTEIYTLSLHDALPIWGLARGVREPPAEEQQRRLPRVVHAGLVRLHHRRSEEHTSELQSRQYLVCRLLLEKKKKKVCMPRLDLVEHTRPIAADHITDHP